MCIIFAYGGGGKITYKAEAGMVVQHKLNGMKMLVLCVSSDDMVTCRYQAENGEFFSCNFYSQEIEELTSSRNNVGFEKGVEK